jgi:hypothetical protein
LREKGDNQRLRFDRFITDANPARGASAPDESAQHEAGEAGLILECMPAGLAVPPDAAEGHDGLPAPS